jgi:hypothetical protein
MRFLCLLVSYVCLIHCCNQRERDVRGNPGAGLDVAGEGFGDANDKLEKIHQKGFKLG